MFEDMNKVELIGAILIIIGIILIGIPLIIGAFILHPVFGLIVLGVAILVIGGFLISKCDDF